jgi:hypothetical protein
MAVLLFGSETSQRIPPPGRLGYGRQRALVGSGRVMDVLMKEVGLRSIAHYVEVQRQHIFNYIVNRPIFDLCWEGVRKRGSSHCQFW